MSFVAPNSPPPAAEEDVTLDNHAFFPGLKLTEFREAMRIDSVTTRERAQHALEAAMIEVNDRLWDWAEIQMAEGHAALLDVPASRGQPEGANKRLYLRAVWCLAKAQLVERYRDYDTTKAGHDKADDLEPAADDYRRDAAWAINDLTRTARTTVELI